MAPDLMRRNNGYAAPTVPSPDWQYVTVGDFILVQSLAFLFHVVLRAAEIYAAVLVVSRYRRFIETRTRREVLADLKAAQPVKRYL